MSAPEPRWTPADYAMLDAETRRVSAEWDEHVEQAIGLTRPERQYAGWVELASLIAAGLICLGWAVGLVWVVVMLAAHAPTVLWVIGGLALAWLVLVIAREAWREVRR